ncbi:MAG TPA: ribonuclease HI family protein [Anaerolineaceae bacterium]|nr:ribonuclease HI family protein [Anaerolineaceae bacterium]HPN53862.1 ribonuclease HI family protein [Anaerolineaceae bacterium]
MRILPGLFSPPDLFSLVDIGRTQVLRVYTDGSIRPELGASGLAAVARNTQGRICGLWQRRAGAMTNNEAEYAAVWMALNELVHLHLPHVEVFSDSRVVVDQMTGRASARAPALKMAYARLLALSTRFRDLQFYHIPREHNRLADALANEIVDGF